MKELPETGAPLATDVGGTERAGRGGNAVLRIDLADRDQVFDLALSLCNAPDRKLFRINHAQWRAIARLAVIAAPVLTHAIALVEASAGGDDQPEAVKARTDLIALTKELMEARHDA